MISTRIVGLGVVSLAMAGVLVTIPMVASAEDEGASSPTSPGTSMQTTSGSVPSALAPNTSVAQADALPSGVGAGATDRSTTQAPRNQADSIVNGGAQPTAQPPGAKPPAAQLLPVDPALPPVPNLSSPLNGVTGLLELNPSAPAKLNTSFTLSGNGITAKVTVNGTKVTATATGLDPTKRYISLYYGSMSTSQAGQTFTCADARTAALPYQWGIQPEWKVNADGTGTLNGTAPRTLADVYTMSIRAVPPTALKDPYILFNPVLYPVVACGATR